MGGEELRRYESRALHIEQPARGRVAGPPAYKRMRAIAVCASRCHAVLTKVPHCVSGISTSDAYEYAHGKMPANDRTRRVRR